VLPNMIVIGAGKAGTTSLHYYLDQHPDIYMSFPKEPFFFHRDNWREQLDWYESLFPKPAPVRGEASPSYSAYPVAKDVPRRIRETIPEAKLIYVVRDPIDRIEAHYAQHRALGKERRSLDEAIDYALREGDDPMNPYICMSSYATQVDQYLAHFPANRLLVIDNVDMREDRRAVLREAFRFLEVDDAFDSPRFDEVLNTERDQVRFSNVGRRLKETRAARFVHARVPRNIRGPITKPLTRALSEPVERQRLSEELRARLRSVLEPEVDRLRQLTGKPFARWSL
jgi:hypothetical protein